MFFYHIFQAAWSNYYIYVKLIHQYNVQFFLLTVVIHTTVAVQTYYLTVEAVLPFYEQIDVNFLMVIFVFVSWMFYWTVVKAVRAKVAIGFFVLVFTGVNSAFYYFSFH